jgi:GTP-binding protein HflX
MSAVSGAGIPDLLVAISDRLRALTALVELVVPYDRGDVLAAIHREGQVLVETSEDTAMRLRVRLDPPAAAMFREFTVVPA